MNSQNPSTKENSYVDRVSINTNTQMPSVESQQVPAVEMRRLSSTPIFLEEPDINNGSQSVGQEEDSVVSLIGGLVLSDRLLADMLPHTCGTTVLLDLGFSLIDIGNFVKTVDTYWLTSNCDLSKTPDMYSGWTIQGMRKFLVWMDCPQAIVLLEGNQKKMIIFGFDDPTDAYIHFMDKEAIVLDHLHWRIGNYNPRDRYEPLDDVDLLIGGFGKSKTRESPSYGWRDDDEKEMARKEFHAHKEKDRKKWLKNLRKAVKQKKKQREGKDIEFRASSGIAALDTLGIMAQISSIVMCIRSYIKYKDPEILASTILQILNAIKDVPSAFKFLKKVCEIPSDLVQIDDVMEFISKHRDVENCAAEDAPVEQSDRNEREFEASSFRGFFASTFGRIINKVFTAAMISLIAKSIKATLDPTVAFTLIGNMVRECDFIDMMMTIGKKGVSFLAKLFPDKFQVHLQRAQDELEYIRLDPKIRRCIDIAATVIIQKHCYDYRVTGMPGLLDDMNHYRELCERLSKELPRHFESAFSRFNVAHQVAETRPLPFGIAIVGPPGTGKTTIVNDIWEISKKCWGLVNPRSVSLNPDSPWDDPYNGEEHAFLDDIGSSRPEMIKTNPFDRILRIEQTHKNFSEQSEAPNKGAIPWAIRTLCVTSNIDKLGVSTYVQNPIALLRRFHCYFEVHPDVSTYTFNFADADSSYYENGFTYIFKQVVPEYNKDQPLVNPTSNRMEEVFKTKRRSEALRYIHDQLTKHIELDKMRQNLKDPICLSCYTRPCTCAKVVDLDSQAPSVTDEDSAMVHTNVPQEQYENKRVDNLDSSDEEKSCCSHNTEDYETDLEFADQSPPAFVLGQPQTDTEKDIKITQLWRELLHDEVPPGDSGVFEEKESEVFVASGWFRKSKPRGVYQNPDFNGDDPLMEFNMQPDEKPEFRNCRVQRGLANVKKDSVAIPIWLWPHVDAQVAKFYLDDYMANKDHSLIPYKVFDNSQDEKDVNPGLNPDLQPVGTEYNHMFTILATHLGFLGMYMFHAHTAISAFLMPILSYPVHACVAFSLMIQTWWVSRSPARQSVVLQRLRIFPEHFRYEFAKFRAYANFKLVQWSRPLYYRVIRDHMATIAVVGALLVGISVIGVGVASTRWKKKEKKSNSRNEEYNDIRGASGIASHGLKKAARRTVTVEIMDRVAYGYFVDSTHVMTVAHLFKGFDPNITVYVRKIVDGEVTYEAKTNVERVQIFPELDIAYVKLKETAVRFGSMFRDGQILPTEPQIGASYYCYDPEDRTNYPLQFVETRLNQSYKDGDNVITIPKGYIFNSPSKRFVVGDCGVVVVDQNGVNVGMLVGTAPGLNTILITPFPKVDLDVVIMPTVQPKMSGSLTDSVKFCSSARPFGASVCIGELRGACGESTKSAAKESFLSKMELRVNGSLIDRSIFGVPSVYRGGVIRRNVSDTHKRNLKILKQAKNEMDSGILRVAIEDYFSRVTASLTPSDVSSIHPETYSNALMGKENGVRIEEIRPMKLHTAVGYPYATGKKRDFITFNGDQVVFDPRFREYLYECEDMLLRGETYFSVVKAQIKDEVVKLSKTKTRLIYVGDTATYCICRKYFWWLPLLVYRHPLEFECAYGINPYSQEWKEIQDYLNVNEFHMAADFSDWDLRLPKQLMDAAFEIMMRLAKLGGGFPDDTFFKAFQPLFTSPVALFGNDLYNLESGTPSGHPLTYIFNSIANSIRARYCFYTLFPTLVYSEHVRGIYGGDDAHETTSLSAYNQLSTLPIMLSLGIRPTDSSKNEVTQPFMEKKDVTFLKRNELGQIDLLTIHKMLTWTTSKKFDCPCSGGNSIIPIRD